MKHCKKMCNERGLVVFGEATYCRTNPFFIQKKYIQLYFLTIRKIQNAVYLVQSSKYKILSLKRKRILLYTGFRFSNNAQLSIKTHFFIRNKDHQSYENWDIVKLDEGDISDRINQYVSSHDTDMLVMAKHNRNFFDRIFHRSLSKEMSYHTKIPLLVLNK